MTLDKSLLPALKAFLPHEGLKCTCLAQGSSTLSKNSFWKAKRPLSRGSGSQAKSWWEHFISCNVQFHNLCLDRNIGRCIFALGWINQAIRTWVPCGTCGFVCPRVYEENTWVCLRSGPFPHKNLLSGKWRSKLSSRLDGSLLIHSGQSLNRVFIIF